MTRKTGKRFSAGSYTGGLYESTDAAVSWSNILSNIYVYDFAINPEDSKTIYAAGYYAIFGRVVKTTDGGASWTDNPGYRGNSPVRAIAINPSNPNQLAIGTADGGVDKTSDGGQTWQLLNNFNDQVNRMFWQGGQLYVLLKTKGLFALPDAATTTNFSELTVSLRQSFNLGDYNVYNANTVGSYSQAYVDVYTQSLIYLTTDKGLYKTTDGGAHWTLLSLPVKLDPENSVRAIAVAQNTSNIVMTSVGSTVYKSNDGGQTWQTQGLTTAGFINCLLIDPQLPR